MGEHAVTVLPAGVTFDCGGDETVLNAALRAGLSLPYGCRKGNCGTCKAQVLEGEVDEESTGAGLTDFEREQGYALLCSSYAAEDLTVEMEALDASELTAERLPAEDYKGGVVRIDTLTHDIRCLELELDRPMVFKAGQFAELGIAGTDIVRAYSMAGSADAPDRLRFLVKLVPNGQFSGRLAELGVGEQLTVRGPQGSFWIRARERPLLLIGGGAGLGPLLSMLHRLADDGDSRPVRLFYGVRAPRDLLLQDELGALAARLPDCRTVFAISDETVPAGLRAEAGLVHEVVRRQIVDIDAHDAYLCGPPGLIDACLDLLTMSGLSDRVSIHYDKFTAS